MHAQAANRLSASRALRFVLVVAAALSGVVARAAADTDGHGVSGVVHRDPFCSGRGAVTVFLEPTTRQTLADASGAFRFAAVADGDYTVSADDSCKPSEYSTDAVFVRGGDAYTELYASVCPQPLVVTPWRGVAGDVGIAGRCYYIHSGASANVYLDNALVGTVRGDTPGNYQTTISVPATHTGWHSILVAIPGPILGRQIGYGQFYELDEPLVCPGDCDADGGITVDELIDGVRLALGEPAQPCPALDPNHTGHVEIEAIIEATGAFLNGCPE